ncbi:hypothetical protein [Paraburkholderia humisilvae]|nr:hypothetical protein [Paraburkholderia humisilvae]
MKSGSALAKSFGGVGGGLWSAGGALSEWGNWTSSTYSRLTSAINAVNIGAGVASTTNALTSGDTQTRAGYASSALWGINAIASGVQSYRSSPRDARVRRYQMLGAGLNTLASGLSATATNVSHNDPDGSAAGWYSLASSVTWGLGAMSMGVAARYERQP